MIKFDSFDSLILLILKKNSTDRQTDRQTVRKNAQTDITLLPPPPISVCIYMNLLVKCMRPFGMQSLDDWAAGKCVKSFYRLTMTAQTKLVLNQ